MNLTQQLILEHLPAASPLPCIGDELSLRVDQALTEDATGLTAYQQFEALGQPLVAGLEAVSLVDHGTLQLSPENAADHRYLRTMAAHYGLYYSPPGNGICHSVFLERFARPGTLLVGADSHTCTAGAVGSLAIGAGGLEFAVALATGRFPLRMPTVVGVELVGQLRPWVGAKDVMLELLRRLGVRWGIGKVVEYLGPGVAALTVAQRVTLANMGAELELVTSLFPADETVRRYLAAQGREDHFRPLAPASTVYDDRITVDLGEIEPLIALPSSPGNVRPLREVLGTPLEQVLVGSCNNSSYEEIALVARLLRGHQVPDHVVLGITPGTRQIHYMLAASGELADLLAAGARILEPCCGPCIGMELRPTAGKASLRTYNRNFPSRSGTIGDQVYLCSPEVAVASALAGVIADPRELGKPPHVPPPEHYPPCYGVVAPPPETGRTPILYGAHHSPVPPVAPLPDRLAGRVLIVLGDEITTDHIMPAKPDTIASCANVQAMGNLVFTRVDPDFPARARSWNGGFIVGGYNYGQGSSREHAVQGPLVLGVRAVLARSFARIHHDNLVNFGILPLLLPDDVDLPAQGDEWEMDGVQQAIRSGRPLTVVDRTRQRSFTVTCHLTPRQVDVLMVGGLLNAVRRQLENG